MTTIRQNSHEVVTLEATRQLTVVAAAVSAAKVWALGSGSGEEPGRPTSIAAGETATFGPYSSRQRFDIVVENGSVDWSEAAVDFPTSSEAVAASSEQAVEYDGTGESYQVIAADLTVADDAGSNDGTDPKFLAPMMGNIMGDAIAGEGNYLGGMVGAYSVVAHASDYPTAALMGIIMDGSVGADAIVAAVIDGDDPSSVTRAKSAFGVRMLNNNAGSGVDYGLDLKDDGSPHYTDDGEPFTVDKAELRFSVGDVCELLGSGAPVNYTDGDPVATGEGFAGPGSRYTDITGKVLYMNVGTKAQPTWSALAFAS